MATEWDDLIKDLAVLNGSGNRDQEYKDLSAATALSNLWAIVEMELKPTAKNLEVLRGLMKEHDEQYYKDNVVPYVKKKYEAEKERLTKEAKALKCEVGIFHIDLTDKTCQCGLYQGCDVCKKFQDRTSR
jgi:hypothetical protein